MQAVAQEKPDRETAAMPVARRWALLALQLPATPSNARVKTWRRLQQLGAVPVKNAVYVLPASTQAVEDFSWLGREVEAMGGQATVFRADVVDTASEAEMIELFQRARAVDYKQLLAEVRKHAAPPARAKRREGRDGKDLRSVRDRLEQVRAIDFFSAPGSAEVEARLVELEREANRAKTAASEHAPAVRLDPKKFTGRVWVRRPRPGVDRCACAWLIRRFIDPQARFEFASDTTTLDDAIAFDMYDVGFRHEGERCTFEVLLWRFGLSEPALLRLAEIVHDIDLKDERYRPAQAPTISLLIDGLQSTFNDDHELLQQGMYAFEALYRAMSAMQPRRTPTESGRPRGRRRP